MCGIKKKTTQRRRNSARVSNRLLSFYNSLWETLSGIRKPFRRIGGSVVDASGRRKFSFEPLEERALLAVGIIKVIDASEGFPIPGSFAVTQSAPSSTDTVVTIQQVMELQLNFVACGTITTLVGWMLTDGPFPPVDYFDSFRQASAISTSLCLAPQTSWITTPKRDKNKLGISMDSTQAS